jgi:hypothetical protein
LLFWDTLPCNANVGARAEAAGIVRRNATARPHLFQAATDDPLHEQLVGDLANIAQP